MAERSAWKKALQEPNAAGWIGLFLLVVAIGAATLWLGADNRARTGPSAGTVEGNR